MLLSKILSFFNNKRENGNGSTIIAVQVEARVKGCQFIENSATLGGAIYSQFSILKIENTNFSKNSANYSGGAIYSLNTQPEVLASQIHNNTAKVSVGAIYFAGIVNEEYQEEDFVQVALTSHIMMLEWMVVHSTARIH